MTPPKKNPAKKGVTKAVRRTFEFAPDHVMFYSDYANLVSTDTEVMLSLYHTVTSLPDKDGHLKGAISYRKASVTMSHAHAVSIGEFLVKHGTQGETK